ncbi:exopolysaccharide biosynthesis protein [Clostridia bacterium]|nr:exopolysaccharide biosynthesis protein [Clostridia bacterium]
MDEKYDMHTHILPEMDDGSPDVDISLMLINELKKQGVTNIALTPHYYSSQESLDSFLKRREKSANILFKQNITNVTFTLGSEVFVTNYIFNNKDLSALCYEKTKFMLTEFPYSSTFTGGSLNKLNKLIANYNIKPIIAHIERYPALLKNPDLIEKLIELGCYMQVNLGSFKQWRVSSKLIKLIKNELVNVVGTDTHSFSRGLDYNTGFGIIEKKAGVNFCNSITKNSANFLKPRG